MACTPHESALQWQAMEFIDTHCHIQEITSDGDPDDLVQSKWAKAGIHDPKEVINEAAEAGIRSLIIVSCTLQESKRAIELASRFEHCYPSIGIHPHEAKDHQNQAIQDDFAVLASLPEVRAIGECGLDYFYNHSPKEAQIELLRFQLAAAQKNNKPVIFHVREAFDDFWPIFDEFSEVNGVLHSYTDSRENLDKAVARGLHIGLNGIMTFTSEAEQLAMARAVPLESLVLETDAPFLTPKPYRGKICTPKHVVDTARFLTTIREESLEELAAATTHNAKELFKLV